MTDEKKMVYETFYQALGVCKAALDCLDTLRVDLLVPRDYSMDDEQAINELRNLSPAAQGFLQHHINSVLCAVSGYTEIGQAEKAKTVVWQLIGIMKKINPQAEVRNASANFETKDTAGMHQAAGAPAGR